MQAKYSLTVSVSPASAYFSRSMYSWLSIFFTSQYDLGTRR